MTNTSRRHERFEEMCAVAAIGELPEAECREFQTHLLICDQCQQTFRDFCRISANYLSSFATCGASNSTKSEDGLDTEELFSACLARAAKQRCEPIDKTPTENHDRVGWLFPTLVSRWIQVPSYSLAAILLLLGAGVAGFYIRPKHMPPSANVVHEPPMLALVQPGNHGVNDHNALRPDFVEETKKIKDLSARYSRLLRDKQDLEVQLSFAKDRLQALDDQVHSYEAQSQRQEASEASMQTRLAELGYRLKAEQQSVADLNERLRIKDEEEAELAAKEPPPISGNDAKTLFGARELHIVDVYDVDGRGKTRKTFGRVYYVEKKFLLFYAFDLQDRAHNRTATAFQAWGYKEAGSSSPQNLGVFDVDDASLHRWVLKVDNPKVLEHVDVVFVTSERSPGSSSPNGQRLLYASLAGVPNHP